MINIPWSFVALVGIIGLVLIFLVGIIAGYFQRRAEMNLRIHDRSRNTPSGFAFGKDE